MATSTDEPKFWNIWWTVTAIAASITFLAGLLEALGVWHDLGLGVGIMGLVATIIGSVTAATRTSIAILDRRLSQMHDTLLHMLRILDQRLPDQH